MTSWVVLCDWSRIDSFFRCGPWMFSKGHHMGEYGWIIELRCNCTDYNDQPPTPKEPAK